MVKKIQENQVGIFTLSWDRKEYTQRCVYALEKNAGWPYFHLIIDQGSKDGSAEWLDKNYRKENTEVILLRENIGLPRGINLAHEILIGGGFEWICKLDNDCEILTPDTLKKLMEAILESKTDLVLSPYVKGLVANKGGVPRGVPSRYPHRWEKYDISYASGVGGIFRLCHKRVLQKYTWDENKPMHYAEDLDFTGRWKENGFMNGYMENVYCLHMDGTLGQQEKYKDYFKNHAGKLDPSKFPNYKPDF